MYKFRVINGVKHYPVSENMKFNLEACHDKLSLMMYEAEEKGDWDAYEKLSKARDESDELSWKAGYGWLSGKEYGKAKEYVAWRIEKRIEANIAGGNTKYLEYC